MVVSLVEKHLSNVFHNQPMNTLSRFLTEFRISWSKCAFLTMWLVWNFAGRVLFDYENVLLTTIAERFLTYDHVLRVVSKTTRQNTGIDNVVLVFTDCPPLEPMDVFRHWNIIPKFYHTDCKRL